jgi:hypothetical protein
MSVDACCDSGQEGSRAWLFHATKLRLGVSRNLPFLLAETRGEGQGRGRGELEGDL